MGGSVEMANKNSDKPKKFFGFELSDTISYIIVAVLAVILIRQIMVLL